MPLSERGKRERKRLEKDPIAQRAIAAQRARRRKKAEEVKHTSRASSAPKPPAKKAAPAPKKSVRERFIDSVVDAAVNPQRKRRR